MSCSLEPEDPLQLGERPVRHQHLLPTAQHPASRAGHAPRGGTSRWRPCAPRRPRPRSSTPVITPRASSVLAARTTWRRASAKSADCDGDRLGRRIDLRGIVVEVVAAHRELRAAGADAHVVVADAELHRPGGKRLHRVGTQAGRHHHRAVGHPAHGDRQSDRHLEVGAGDRQLVAAHLQVHPFQHGQRAGATGGGSTRRRQRVGEDVTFTSELHSRTLPMIGVYDGTSSVVGAVDWGQHVVVAAYEQWVSRAALSPVSPRRQMTTAVVRWTTRSCPRRERHVSPGNPQGCPLPGGCAP